MYRRCYTEGKESTLFERFLLVAVIEKVRSMSVLSLLRGPRFHTLDVLPRDITM